MIIFFFFFFDELYYIAEIQEAFRNICLNKMLADGYFDMSAYIFGRFKKEAIYASLSASKSKYAILYQNSYPKPENAYNVWMEKIGDRHSDDICNENYQTLTYNESSAIVNWVYRTLKNAQEREEFTKQILRQIKDFHAIENKVKFANGVVYNASKVDLYFVSSVAQVNSLLSQFKRDPNVIFYRGHSNANFTLLPSIMRTPQLERNESNLYQDLIINCPADFENCSTHLEKLVKMQHYGLPTRLLDITRNPLVALYFACESNPETYGELILISAKNEDIKYPQSDTISVLSSLPTFSYKKQTEFRDLAEDSSITSSAFNKGISRLIHEVRLEKPAFQAEVKKQDILNNYIVYALKSNNRIIKQDGAFILCGLAAKTNGPENFRYRIKGKKVVILMTNKKKIIEQLETFSINRASLFPEIECVAEYLKAKYCK